MQETEQRQGSTQRRKRNYLKLGGDKVGLLSKKTQEDIKVSVPKSEALPGFQLYFAGSQNKVAEAFLRKNGAN